MKTIFKKPNSLTDTVFHYCPGCSHGIVHRLVCEVIDELDISGKTIAVEPVGCAVTAHNYFDFDVVQAAHGRAPAVATGIKRSLPDRVVFTYQGDGDLASIGTAETVHSAARGENITVIFINNTIYGMTGGQMAPTSLPGQVTQTSPYGRDPKIQGNPVRVCEMLATLDGPSYIARVSTDSVPHIKDAKKAIKKAFENQIKGKGFSIVEVLSTCPTNWGMSPVEAMQRVRDEMIPYYPLGVFKDIEDVEEDKIMKNCEMILAGFGGQGILFTGKILAFAAMLKEKKLSWLPSYGPEMRGGTANCHVIIDDEPIGSPIVTRPNILVAMNKPSLDKFENTVSDGGYVFIDTSLIDRRAEREDVNEICVNATETAHNIGNKSLANMVMLGAVLKKTELFTIDEIEYTMKKSLPENKHKLIEMNIKAVKEGYNLV